MEAYRWKIERKRIFFWRVGGLDIMWGLAGLHSVQQLFKLALFELSIVSDFVKCVRLHNLPITKDSVQQVLEERVKTKQQKKWERQCSYEIKLHVNNQNNWVKKRVCVNSPRHTPPDRPCPPPEWQSLRSGSGVETDDLSSTSCWGLPPDPWTRSPEIQHKKIYVTLKQKGHPWKVCLGSWMNK